MDRLLPVDKVQQLKGVLVNKRTRNFVFLLLTVIIIFAINALLPTIEGNTHYTADPVEMTYEEYIKAYEEYLELQNNNNNPQDTIVPGEDGLSTGEIILIVCGSLLGVCVIAFGAFFVIKYVKKGKGGKENEENN